LKDIITDWYLLQINIVVVCAEQTGGVIAIVSFLVQYPLVELMEKGIYG
jgi:hypothetical protein